MISTNSFVIVLTTLKRKLEVLLTSVNVRMFLHIRFLVETFATILAWIRSSIWMDKEMCRQSGWSLKSFSTLLAFKNFFNVVYSSERNENISL